MDYWYEWHYEYDPSDRPSRPHCSTRTAPVNWTEYEYDSQGYLVKETYYYGHDGKAASTNEYLNDIYGQPLVVRNGSAANSWFIPMIAGMSTNTIPGQPDTGGIIQERR